MPDRELSINLFEQAAREFEEAARERNRWRRRAELAERQLERSMSLIFIGQKVIQEAHDQGWKHGDESSPYDFLLRKMYEAGLKDAKKCT